MKQLEHEEQSKLFEWANHYSGMNELCMMFAIPNGGHRHKAVAAKLKREGVCAGVPDIFLPVPRGCYHGMFIEMKAGKNKPTDAQNAWLACLRSHGYHAVVCNGFDSAREAIVEYMACTCHEMAESGLIMYVDLDCPTHGMRSKNDY